MEYYFDRDDRLDRLKYAEFLKTLLLNCDKYRREDSDGAYVIALDSPWGTGKTRFVKMLRNHLEKRKSEDGDNSKTKKDAEFNVIYYNAWDTDFCVDALEPLIYTVVNSPELNPSRFRKGVKQLLEEFGELASDVAKILAYSVAGRILGETAAGEIKNIVDRGDIDENDPLKDYKERLDLYSDFKEALGKIIKATKKNLVIVVDELDRCRPTFAIQTLELAKHLFAVPGLIFIFSLDIKQLSCSVETIYGQKMDATGYLCRFFEYVCQIPLPNIKLFILFELSRIRYFTDRQEIDKVKQSRRDVFAGFVQELYEEYGLSLRDLTTLFQSYILVENTFLDKYETSNAHELYFILLLFKYKDINLYRIITSGRVIAESDVLASSQIDKKLYRFRSLSEKMKELIINKPIYEIWYEVIDNQEVLTKRKIKVKGFQAKLNYRDNKQKLRCEYEYSENGGELRISSDDFEDTYSLKGVLFFEDLKKWDQIKHLTLAQYYHRQLEMFDFVLPADEAKIEP